MRILADCGNSTVKLALAQDGGVWVQERVAVDPTAFADFVARHGGALDAAVVLPGAQRSAEVFAAWWARAGAGKPLLRIGHELPLPDLGQYPGCGADRIVAGLAACAQERHDVVVVDAGTATTLTAWRCTGRGRLLGGLILPGAQACAAGLAAAAPALPSIQPLAPDALALQRDTVAAIGAALGIGYGAMVAACLARVRAETGIEAVIVTGGAAMPMLGRELPRSSYRPSLVVEGMELLARGT